MSETITGLIVAILTLVLNEMRRRWTKKPVETIPPPPSVEDCKRCFFFRQFSRNSRRLENVSDTQVIKLYRETEEIDANNEN